MMEVCKFLTVQECENIVRQCLKSDNVKTIDFAIVRLQNNNFLVKILVNHEAKEKTLNFFAKPTSNEKVPTIYKILFDDFKKTLPQIDLKITPKLYFGKSELQLYEDLTWQGYQTNKSNLLNLDEIQIALKILAKFHASGLAFEEIKAKQLGRSYRLSEDYALIEPKMKKTELLASYGDQIDALVEFQISPKFRRTLSHSNLISNNLMFKHEKGNPVDCKLLNLKSQYYAPPAYDVLLLIFFNSSACLRQHHFHSLLEYYHHCLKSELDSFSLDIGEIVPLEDFYLSAHHLLPMVKLETMLIRGNNLEECREILECSIISREDCYEIIRNKLQTSNYELLEFKVTPLNQTNGFLGDYHKLHIKIRHQYQEKNINCFVKCMPKGSSSKSLVVETGCFLKETFIYKTLVPKMQELGINLINECLPCCYFQRAGDLMVFEDVSMLGYRTLESHIPFDFDLLSLVMSKLGKLHASLFAFEEKISEKLGQQWRAIDDYGPYLEEIFFLKNDIHSGAKIMQTGIKSIPHVIDLFPELQTENNLENLKKIWPQLEEIFYTVTRPSSRFRNIISHGDLWTQNIMVKFEGDKPVDCYFIDFQCTRYCPPAHDVISILHLTTDRKNRSLHKDKVMTIYHNELAKSLAKFNYNVNDIYPYQDFIESMEMIRPQMLLQTTAYSMFCPCTSEEISSILVNDEMSYKVFFVDRKEYLQTMTAKSAVVKNKLKECLLDLFEFCECKLNCVK